MQALLASRTRAGVLVGLGLLSAGAFAAPLDAGLQQQVRTATFEVVIPKPERESVRYDKPWHDALPYQLRSDAYVSIGTAFAIGPNRYATAMHVLQGCFGDARGEPLLRDAAGKLYPIAQITQGSMDQDFAVFTLATPPAHSSFLALNDRPELNGTVYAVGNALGEGIVMREGNYTSDTPEEDSGRWKWLRFSAPISGGNSGGPLIDAQGRVIGIVRAMRSTENTLNFAVPAALVMAAPEGRVSVDARIGTGLPVFDKTRSARFQADIPAPQRFGALAAAYLQRMNEFEQGQLQALLADNAADLFPRGAGSQRLLHANYQRSAPALITQNGSGSWVLTPLSYTRLDLGHEGWQDAASFKGYTVFHRRKPDDIDQAAWYTQPALVRDTVLKASPSTIHVNNETAKVLSLGAPTEDSRYTDHWGRVWQLRSWRVTTWFGSDWLLAFDLPVPDGSVGLETRVSSAGHEVQIARMKQLVDFLAASYDGNLAQWTGFLHQQALLPRPLAQTALQLDYDRRFAFDNRRVAFSYGPELQKIAPAGRLRLDFAHVREPAGVALEVAGVVAYNPEDHTEIDVFRHVAPAAAGTEAAQADWKRRTQRAHPYDAVAVTTNERQVISTILGGAGGADVPAPSEVLYTFQYRAESGTPQDQMKSKLDLLTRQAQVNEGSEGR